MVLGHRGGGTSFPLYFTSTSPDSITVFPGSISGMSRDGGYALRLINKTGAPSIKGTLVEASSTAGAFDISDANEDQPIGIVYENGIADGSLCWIITSGRCQVLLKDSTATTAGYWVRTSDTGGRALGSNATPPGGGIPELDIHMQEIGHSLETNTGGTNVLVYIICHFN